MAKRKVLYCRKCGKKTVHNFINREMIVWTNWQCECCKNIRLV